MLMLDDLAGKVALVTGARHGATGCFPVLYAFHPSISGEVTG
jgi:hypothetical protein